MIVVTKMSKKSNTWILRDQVLLLEKLVRDKNTNSLDKLVEGKKNPAVHTLCIQRLKRSTKYVDIGFWKCSKKQVKKSLVCDEFVCVFVSDLEAERRTAMYTHRHTHKEERIFSRRRR